MLDGLMMEHEPNSRFMAGYIREVQLRRMLQLVREPNVTHYCEVGMNGGHSLVAMLLGNPNATAHNVSSSSSGPPPDLTRESMRSAR